MASKRGRTLDQQQKTALSEIKWACYRKSRGRWAGLDDYLDMRGMWAGLSSLRVHIAANYDERAVVWK